MKRAMSGTGQITLGNQLRRINRITLAVALGIVAAIIFASSFMISLFSLVESSQVKARVLSDNAAASLMFVDTGAAQELLRSLRHSPDVHGAAIYDKDGQAFARYILPNHALPAVLDSLRERIEYGFDSFILVQPIIQQGEAIGSLYLMVDLGSLYAQIAWQALTTLAAALLALGAASILLRRLNLSVLRPLDRLSALMGHVSSRKDYSVRAESSDIAELHALSAGFNDMLEQIHQRDQTLASHRDALRASEARLYEAQAVARLGSWHLNLRDHGLEWSPETYRIFGVPSGQRMTYQAFLQCVHEDDRSLLVQAWHAALTGAPYRIEHRIIVNGEVRWVVEQAELSFDEKGNLLAGTGTVQDITERKEIESQTFRLAYFDGLTGLPNRQSFLERLAREVRETEGSGKKLAILFMDLDGFKAVNDTMGHTTGDMILQWTAERLNTCVRPADMVSRMDADPAEVEFARLGGDEFTAIIPNIAQAEDALRVAHRIREQMRRPFVLDGRDLVLTASIGIAVYPDDGPDAASLLKHADTAMYHAKDSGRDNCQFYSASLTQRAQQRLNLENNMRHALEREEFRLVYQPQLDLASGRIHSVEALIRWDHPTDGTISPMEFIPLAEENGLIVPIGEWVLRTACSDAARWQREGHDLTVAVNLSPMQFKDPNLVRTVLDILTQTGLTASLLELEVTETAVMEDSVATLATLEALNCHGVQIALDDFGTGYSSMNYLKRMPLNNLKVDKSFVQGLPHDRDNHAIVRAILSLAKNLGFSVTAEGVETIEQVEALRGMACDSLQGYYFSRPVPAADIPALLNRTWDMEGATNPPDLEASIALD